MQLSLNGLRQISSKKIRDSSSENYLHVRTESCQVHRHDKTSHEALKVKEVGYAIQLFSAALIGHHQVHPDIRPVGYRQQYLLRTTSELDWAATNALKAVRGTRDHALKGTTS